MREKEKAHHRASSSSIMWALQGLLRPTTPRAEIAQALSGIVQVRGCRLAQKTFWLEVLDVWCEQPIEIVDADSVAVSGHAFSRDHAHGLVSRPAGLS